MALVGYANHGYDVPPLESLPSKRNPINAGLVDVIRCYKDGRFRSVMYPAVEFKDTYLADMEETVVGPVGATRFESDSDYNWAERYVPGGAFHNAISLFVLCVKTGSGTTRNILFHVGNTGSALWQLEIRAGHTSVRIGINDSGGFKAADTGTFTALAQGDVFSAGGVLSPFSGDTGQLLAYFNGTLETVDGADLGFRANTGNTDFSPLAWIGTLSGSSASAPDCKVAMAAIWNRKVANRDMARLAGDPYMIFRDPTPTLAGYESLNMTAASYAMHVNDTQGNLKLTNERNDSLVIGEG